MPMWIGCVRTKIGIVPCGQWDVVAPTPMRWAARRGPTCAEVAARIQGSLAALVVPVEQVLEASAVRHVELSDRSSRLIPQYRCQLSAAPSPDEEFREPSALKQLAGVPVREIAGLCRRRRGAFWLPPASARWLLLSQELREIIN
jgi:hypothetical protein